jgi:hypothetical protein
MGMLWPAFVIFLFGTDGNFKGLMNPLLSWEFNIKIILNKSCNSAVYWHYVRVSDIYIWLTRAEFLGDTEGRPSHVTLVMSAEWVVYFLRD